MRISIALATFNGERYLQDQLDSFSGQTRLPDELIVCDDCSSDSTLKIVEQFERTAPFTVRIIANERNIGYVENFSNALELCTGDIVFLSDQDDFWLPNKLATVESYLAAHPDIQLVAHDIDYCKADLRSIGQTKMERMKGLFDLKICYVVGMASAIRGEFLSCCLPIPQCPGLTHDSWLHMCTNTLGKKAILDEVLALHRRHGTNVTSDSLLNVDFVTSPDHFKPRQLTLKKRMDLMRHEIVFKSEESSLLISWLRRNRDIFLERGYDEAASLDNRMDQLIIQHKAQTLRSSILSGDRSNNLTGIIKLYRKGGYAFFRGWKSLIGDVIFRCVFRW